MTSAFWLQVVADGLKVPENRPLDEMTADLTRMLGDSDPDVRDGIAFPTLGTWISEGVYDDLLRGLGDGMCSGLDVGLGEETGDSVFRRSFSALVLTECIDRDSVADLLTRDQVLRWGDRIAGWLLRERDLRGFVPGHGWALALAHGADALGAMMRSPKLGQMELVVLLDVIADRLLQPTETFFVCGEDDRIAAACLHGLRRNLLGIDVLDSWIARIAAAAVPSGSAQRNPYLVAGNAQSFLRSLHLQLALAPDPPLLRTDLLLVLIEHLRATNKPYLAQS
ncbi:MAG: DUF2785 domain-containing protein [Marmoricola sp.]